MLIIAIVVPKTGSICWHLRFASTITSTAQVLTVQQQNARSAHRNCGRLRHCSLKTFLGWQLDVPRAHSLDLWVNQASRQMQAQGGKQSKSVQVYWALWYRC